MHIIRLLFLGFWSLTLCGCVTNSPPQNNTQLAEIDTELAVLDVHQNQAAQAKIHLLEATALAPDDPMVLAGEGFYDLNMHETAEATSFYNQAIGVAPNNPEIQNDYGVFLYQTQQFSQALVYFLKAAYNPDNLYAGDAFENAGLTELSLGDSAAAGQDFKSATLQGYTGADAAPLKSSDDPR